MEQRAWGMEPEAESGLCRGFSHGLKKMSEDWFAPTDIGANRTSRKAHRRFMPPPFQKGGAVSWRRNPVCGNLPIRLSFRHE
jgi:hypothetical protein